MSEREDVARDILKGGEEHFQFGIQADRVLFWAAGADGRCELVSANWSAMTAQDAHAALGDGWLDRVDPEDAELVARTVRQAIVDRCGFYLRYRLRAGEAGVRWVLHDASPRFLPSGQFNGLVGTLNDCGDMHAADVALQTLAQKVYDYVDEVPLAAVAIDMQGRIVHCNDMLAAILGTKPAALIGDEWAESRVIDADRDRVRGLVDGSLPASALPVETEYSIRTAEGVRLFRWHLTLVREFDGRPVSLTMLGNDITRWRREGDNLRLSARFVESASEAIMITDRDNNIVAVNPAFTLLSGYPAEEVLGKNPRLLKSGRHDDDFYREMWRQLLTQGYWRGDIWDRHRDGRIYPKFLAISVVRDAAGEIVNFSGIFHDASERKALEDHLDRLAHFDELTGLPNRALLQDRLEQAIVAAERLGQKFALLFIDLDGFKPINDTYGHATGDELLREVAARLRSGVRGMDTAARLGGDEFVVILTDVRSVDAAMQVATKLGDALAAEYRLGGIPIPLSASIGVSIYPTDELAAGGLLRTADEAMYSAKREGKRRVSLYGTTA